MRPDKICMWIGILIGVTGGLAAFVASPMHANYRDHGSVFIKTESQP